MRRLYRLLFALLLGTFVPAASRPTLAESGILVVHVKDVQHHPIRGVEIGVEGDGGFSITGDDGKARIKLARDTREKSWVALQILKSPPGKDFMMVSPWDYKTLVPPFENESENFIEVVVVQSGDRTALESGTVLKALAEKINQANAPKTDQQGRQLDPTANLAAVAKQYGLVPDGVDQAIRAWGKKATDQYEAGIAALYEQNYPKASEELADSLQQREKELQSNENSVADAACFLGVSLYEEGRYRDSAAAYRRYLQLRPDDIVATSGLGLSLLLAGDYEASEPLLQRVVDALEKTRMSNPAPFVSSLNNLAVLRKAKGQYADSEQLLRRGVMIANETLASEDSTLLTITESLAVILKTEGKYKEAEPLYRSVAETDTRVSGPDSINAANSQYNLGQLLSAEQRYPAAESCFREALEIVEKKLPPSHPHIADCLRGLGEALLAQGDLTDAEPPLRRARDIDEKALGPNHSHLAFDLIDMAMLLRDKHRYGEAEPLARHALDIQEAALGPDHPEVAIALNNLALLIAVRGDYAGAESLERRALRIQEGVLGQDHPQTQQTRRNLQALINEKAAKKKEK
jgi:tetratricopeptide (TPR) repeat protein